MKICGIVGLKNSGKTFFAQKIIKYFSDHKYKVASIKHAHHDFEIDKPDTDSFLHRKAGSKEVIISSSKRWAKINELDNREEKTLKDLIEHLDKPDIVIVEGFKKENHKKIEIISNNSLEDQYLFPNLKNVFCIISDKQINTSITQFKINEIKNIANYILEKI
ncbi:MAG: Molybdopterin-guanine dinucleotide biosynthesis adapter protein [Alphaproteobacteria bacterium MarineAlpha5_Bin8]|nr:MAG: Molybdopterin-guanine dinucleotide biosynthesis adapter protein [Alphaproteobacteria bacterium MarineAlpha5_Bin7]PPR46110.1 MAG: Molybdopterin-guanine dinucleotide biosynthesis adapter protein [Alphaproteobacteria bacterium MarineAlpha5_Bin8]PPR53031.1 MAG: Molybdopterin-guanine dinucleotide biosynthesis adapter protein [Alphaproteobacteria bacterium MarineAlpha5_Bin6]|tara:strand:- start:264 stop:752 length:489 start_codon:yes stop_codon:yes gene_type:complete